MQPKKPYSLWVSHSSIGDFLACPRSYYIKHIYRNPKTGNKVSLINPSLALGQTVHFVLEALSTKPVEERFKESLIDNYNKAWEKISGKLGGFKDSIEEMEYKNRGSIMINRVMFHPGPLLNKALKLSSPDALPPRFYLSREDDIILCGKIDWLEYVPADDSVHVIDFKTGVNEEKEESLQLPIYTLLVTNCQGRKVSKVSYWYLEKDNDPKEMPMPDLEKAKEAILKIALQIKDARAKNEFACPRNGCFVCKPWENIVTGKATFIGTNDYQDIFINEETESSGEFPKEDLMPF